MGRCQVVPLDLSQGFVAWCSHSLVLSVKSTASPGRTATDSDRLVFLVQ
jgi:hypothetical protein